MLSKREQIGIAQAAPVLDRSCAGAWHRKRKARFAHPRTRKDCRRTSRRYASADDVIAEALRVLILVPKFRIDRTSLLSLKVADKRINFIGVLPHVFLDALDVFL
jgi:hypothetical protein